MNENNRIKAKEWYEKAKHDLETVNLIIESSGYPDTATVLLQQAVEKYLKGYLIGRGWKLIKTHDIKFLIDEAIKYNNYLEKFYDLADWLTKYYIEEKYPPVVIEVSLEELKANYEIANELIKIILETKC